MDKLSPSFWRTTNFLGIKKWHYIGSYTKSGKYTITSINPNKDFIVQGRTIGSDGKSKSEWATDGRIKLYNPSSVPANCSNLHVIRTDATKIQTDWEYGTALTGIAKFELQYRPAWSTLIKHKSTHSPAEFNPAELTWRQYALVDPNNANPTPHGTVTIFHITEKDNIWPNMNGRFMFRVRAVNTNGIHGAWEKTEVEFSTGEYDEFNNINKEYLKLERDTSWNQQAFGNMKKYRLDKLNKIKKVNKARFDFKNHLLKTMQDAQALKIKITSLMRQNNKLSIEQKDDLLDMLYRKIPLLIKQNIDLLHEYYTCADLNTTPPLQAGEVA